MHKDNKKKERGSGVNTEKIILGKLWTKIWTELEFVKKSRNI